MEENTKESKFSSGINIIMRLDGLWKDANTHSRANQYSKWNADLDRTWVELARDISDNEYNDKEKDGVKKEGFKTKFDSFDNKIAEIDPDFHDGYAESNGFHGVNKEVLANRGKHYKLLMEKELFLKRLENHLKKGTTYDDEDGYDFE